MPGAHIRISAEPRSKKRPTKRKKKRRAKNQNTTDQKKKQEKILKNVHDEKFAIFVGGPRSPSAKSKKRPRQK